jgi:single-stranded-DNA-specific exonuclease
LIAPFVAPQWVVHPRADIARARQLARDLGVPLAAAQALVNRGVHDAAEAQRFLDPTLELLHDPFLLKGVAAAVERIERAARDGEPVLIFGDYDVDGITSTYLLYTVLTQLGARAEYRIPHRTRDGYGLSIEAVEQAYARGVKLVVTVDCGITAIEPVSRGRELGIDTVITDHHEPAAFLPAASAIVNPHQPGCTYPFKQLAGVGVTYKLVEALLRDGGAARPSAVDFLDVVSIGTIADVVPLVDENRVLARAGLSRIARSPRLGLRALIDVAGLGGREITSGHVAFVLAPRINAAGRMGNAEQGMRLLLARDPDEARACAESLEEDNQRRREADELVLNEASRLVEQELHWPDCASILLWSERWHPGVIGIVASRLVERFQRPTVLVALHGDRGRGSGRSLPGLDLNALLTSCSDLLEAHGGHAFAAGLTIRAERLPALRERLEVLVRERLTPDQFVPRLTIDGEARLGECDLELVAYLERLSPHGLENPEPVFAARGVSVDNVTTVGGGRHLKMRLRDATGVAEGIGFGLAERAPGARAGGVADVAFVPSRNEWRGDTQVQLRLKDLKIR